MTTEDAVLALARPEIVALSAYRPARFAPGLDRLHANEMPWRALHDASEPGLHRYPDPYHDALDARLADAYGVPAGCALATRGSDEAIDLLVRCFCRADRDAVLVCPPTFGMYAMAARIQGARVVEVPLLRPCGWALDVDAVLAACTPDVRLVFLCSPNNPTGNALAPADLAAVTSALAGRAIVVVDEAYLELSGDESCAQQIVASPHVVVLRTCSKAHALAGARVGTLLAARVVIDLVRKVLPPYALSQPSIDAAFRAFEPSALTALAERLATIRAERSRLRTALLAARGTRVVWPSVANFLLVERLDATGSVAQALQAGLLVRDFSHQPGLPDAIRVTVGSPDENNRLIEAWS